MARPSSRDRATEWAATPILRASSAECRPEFIREYKIRIQPLLDLYTVMAAKRKKRRPQR